MTTLLTISTPAGTAAEAQDADAGCGCCVPPPDASAEGRRVAMAQLEARRAAVERRLRGLQPEA